MSDLIRFSCPSCAARIGAPLAMNAEVIECPNCETGLLVPDPTQSGTVTADGLILAEESAFGFNQGRDTSVPEMDMTPMVDVTFLLLIFFMVTAAFSLQKSFEIPTPREERPSTQVVTMDDFEEDPEYVVVRIDENSTFFVSTAEWDEEQEAPSRQDLLISLKLARDSAATPPSKLLVIAHTDAWHEKIVMALDAGTEVGITDVKLVTMDEEA